MKALITKLNGAVADTSLLKLGELRVYFSKKEDANTKNRGICLAFAENTDVSVVNGHFTDSTLSQDLGTTISFSANIEQTIYVSNDDCFISIANKYAITRISTIGFLSTMKFDVGDLHYSSKLVRLEVGYTNCYGDVNKVADADNIAFAIFAGSNVEGEDPSLAHKNSLVHLEITSKMTLDVATVGSNLLFFDGGQSQKTSWSNRDAANSIFGMKNVHFGNNVDAVLTNLSKCTYMSKMDKYSNYKKIGIYGTRTSASDSAVSILQTKGFTVSVTPEPTM